jgi:hypothetical protein
MNNTYWIHWTPIRDHHDPAYGCPGGRDRWVANDEAVAVCASGQNVAGPDGNNFGWHIWIAGNRLLCERAARHLNLSPSCVANVNYRD